MSSSDNATSGYILCAWCQKPGIKLFTLRTSGGVKAFCSELCFTQCRRAFFKKNKICDWCKHVRHTVNYVDFQDGEQQLQFCSSKCLNQYKMNIFCRETQEHLQQIQQPGDGGAPTVRKNSSSNATAAGSGEQILITPELWMDRSQDGLNDEEEDDTESEKQTATAEMMQRRAKMAAAIDSNGTDEEEAYDDVMDYEDKSNSGDDGDDGETGQSSCKRDKFFRLRREETQLDKERMRRLRFRDSMLKPLSVTTSPLSSSSSTPISVTSSHLSPPEAAMYSQHSPAQGHTRRLSSPTSALDNSHRGVFSQSKSASKENTSRSGHSLCSSKSEKMLSFPLASPHLQQHRNVSTTQTQNTHRTTPQSHVSNSATPQLLSLPNQPPPPPMFPGQVPAGFTGFPPMPYPWMMGGNPALPAPPAVFPGSILMVPCPIPIPIPIPIPFPFPIKTESLSNTNSNKHESSSKVEKCQVKTEPLRKVPRLDHSIDDHDMDTESCVGTVCSQEQICCASCQTERHCMKRHHTSSAVSYSMLTPPDKCEQRNSPDKLNTSNMGDSECSLITSSSDIEETAIDLSKDKHSREKTHSQASPLLEFPTRGSATSIFHNDKIKPVIYHSPMKTPPPHAPQPLPTSLLPVSTPPGIVLTCPPTQTIPSSHLPPPADHAYSSRRGRILDAPSVPRQRSPSPTEKRIMLRNSSRDYLHKRRCLRTRIKTK